MKFVFINSKIEKVIMQIFLEYKNNWSNGNIFRKKFKEYYDIYQEIKLMKK